MKSKISAIKTDVDGLDLEVTTVVLSEKGWQQLMEIMDRPPRVNKALKEAAANRKVKRYDIELGSQQTQHLS